LVPAPQRERTLYRNDAIEKSKRKGGGGGGITSYEKGRGEVLRRRVSFGAGCKILYDSIGVGVD